MGPPKLMWMMRYESKHGFFTDLAKKTQNFINISNSFSKSHQKYICAKKCSYSDDIHVSCKACKLTNCQNYAIYRPYFNCLQDFDANSLKSLLFIKINCNEYRKGLIVIHEKKVSEIIYVLCSDSNQYVFCHNYNVKRFDNSMNSFEIEKTEFSSENFRLINIEQLTINECYERKFANHNIYLIAENMEILRGLWSE